MQNLKIQHFNELSDCKHIFNVLDQSNDCLEDSQKEFPLSEPRLCEIFRETLSEFFVKNSNGIEEANFYQGFIAGLALLAAYQIEIDAYLFDNLGGIDAVNNDRVKMSYFDHASRRLQKDGRLLLLRDSAKKLIQLKIAEQKAKQPEPENGT